MNKGVHTVLCWLLAVSMVWVPISVSASFSLISKISEHCHEMTTTMSNQIDSAHSMDRSSIQKDGCRQCGDSCDCTSMTTCAHGSSHTSAFIKIDYILLCLIQSTQNVSEHHARYPSQIITPDIRPPIV